MKPLLRTLFVSITLILIGGVALSAVTDRFHAFTSEAVRRIAVRQHPVDVPVVTLDTQSGTRISISDLRGKWLLVDFIYTRCLTYCAALGNEFAQLQGKLAGPIAQGKAQLISISFDPAHDTPRELTSYLQRSRSRGAGWLAVRPVDPAGLAQLKRSFGITVIPDGLGGYTHNAAIHVVNPQGKLVEIVDLEQSDLAMRTILEGIER